jgi:uncharacterized membrane protein YgcG
LRVIAILHGNQSASFLSLPFFSCFRFPFSWSFLLRAAMSGTQSQTQSSTSGALTNATTAALISEIASAAATAAASTSGSGPTQNINIKSLIPITLDMESTSFRRWRSTFRVVLGRFDLLGHINANNPRPDDPAWVQADLTVLMWIHATLADDLMDMVMEDNPTAYSVWKQISDFFNANKSSRAVQLETEFHGLQQGDLSSSEYCRRLKTLADALADCDQPLRGRSLVHQLVAGLNPRYNTLKTMIPALPQFPTFIQARSLLLAEEASQNKSKSPAASTESALVTTEGSDSATDGSASRSDSGGDRSNTSGGGRSGGRPNNSSGGGRGGGRGRGRGRHGGRGNFYNNGAPGGRDQQQPSPQWPVFYPPWGAPWGVLGVRRGQGLPGLVQTNVLLTKRTTSTPSQPLHLRRSPGTHPASCTHFMQLLDSNNPMVNGSWTPALLHI